VSAPTGLPFVLHAFECGAQTLTQSGQGYDFPIYQIMEQSSDAVTADQTGVVLDFAANALTTKTADISATVPTRADSPVRKGRGSGVVCNRESLACTGYSTHIDISTDGNQFDDTLIWAEPTWVTHPWVQIAVYDGNDRISSRTASSWPTSGSIGALPDTPEWVTPAPGTPSHKLHDAIEWKNFEDPPVTRLWLQGANGLAWLVYSASKTATTLSVPMAPSPVDEAQLFGVSLNGTLQTGWREPGLLAFSAQSATKPLTMRVQ
jgi:hypothetical protein